MKEGEAATSRPGQPELPRAGARERPETGRPVNGHGVGLASIRERLVSLYGERGQVVLRGKPGAGVQAEVRLPFRPVRVEVQNVET